MKLKSIFILLLFFNITSCDFIEETFSDITGNSDFKEHVYATIDGERIDFTYDITLMTSQYSNSTFYAIGAFTGDYTLTDDTTLKMIFIGIDDSKTGKTLY